LPCVTGIHMHGHLQDIEVIRMVLQGNQQAYALLVDRYSNYVFTLVLRYVPGREEAEEAAQDVFVKAYRSLADFRGQCKFSTWLYTIVNSTCISRLRMKKDQASSMDHEQLSGLGNAVIGMDKAIAAMEQKSQRSMLEAAIAQLQEVDGQIITLYYQHEQTTDEIATILGLTSNHVKVRLFRARQRLKQILEQQFPREIAHR